MLKRKLVLLEIITDTDVTAGSVPVYANGQVMGQCASSGYGYRCEKSLALIYIDIDPLAADDLQVRISGDYLSARITNGCIYDPKGERS
jgi:glycine cleavage system aminomethyltransferase T